MISGAIYTALQGFVNGRCYANEFPQPPELQVWPAIRFQLTGAEAHAAVCGTGSVDTDTSDYQIDVVAKTFGAMITVRNQVIAALIDFDPPAGRDGMFELTDEQTKTHRCVLLYSFHPSST